MATDQSPPRSNLILVMAVGTVITLISLKFVFDSYFTDIMEDVARAKVAVPEEVVTLHADEQKRLTTSPAVPIDQAMAQLAGKGRLSSADISPNQSDDMAPVVGWQHLHDGENGAAPAPATSAMGAGDAGTTTTPPGPPPGFDGGAGNVAPGAGADAGAPHVRYTTIAPTHSAGPVAPAPSATATP